MGALQAAGGATHASLCVSRHAAHKCRLSKREPSSGEGNESSWSDQLTSDERDGTPQRARWRSRLLSGQASAIIVGSSGGGGGGGGGRCRAFTGRRRCYRLHRNWAWPSALVPLEALGRAQKGVGRLRPQQALTAQGQPRRLP